MLALVAARREELVAVLRLQSNHRRVQHVTQDSDECHVVESLHVDDIRRECCGAGDCSVFNPGQF